MPGQRRNRVVQKQFVSVPGCSEIESKRLTRDLKREPFVAQLETPYGITEFQNYFENAPVHTKGHVDKSNQEKLIYFGNISPIREIAEEIVCLVIPEGRTLLQNLDVSVNLTVYPPFSSYEKTHDRQLIDVKNCTETIAAFFSMNGREEIRCKQNAFSDPFVTDMTYASNPVSSSDGKIFGPVVIPPCVFRTSSVSATCTPTLTTGKRTHTVARSPDSQILQLLIKVSRRTFSGFLNPDSCE